jgi:hypothetical protein
LLGGCTELVGFRWQGQEQFRGPVSHLAAAAEFVVLALAFA